MKKRIHIISIHCYCLDFCAGFILSRVPESMAQITAEQLTSVPPAPENTSADQSFQCPATISTLSPIAAEVNLTDGTYAITEVMMFNNNVDTEMGLEVVQPEWLMTTTIKLPPSTGKCTPKQEVVEGVSGQAIVCSCFDELRNINFTSEKLTDKMHCAVDTSKPLGFTCTPDAFTIEADKW